MNQCYCWLPSRRYRQMGHDCEAFSQLLRHPSWNMCFFEQGSTYTCSLMLKFWKHMLQLPSVYWIIWAVAGEATKFRFYLPARLAKKQHQMQATQQIMGESARAIKKRMTIHTFQASRTRKTMLTPSSAADGLLVARATIPVTMIPKLANLARPSKKERQELNCRIEL